MPTLAEHPKKQAIPSPERKVPLVLRCFMWSSAPGVYYAECVDLNLAVRADTPERTMQSLHDAIVGYLQAALNGNPDGLIPRPSPLSHRLRYRLFCLLAAVSIKRQTLRLFDCSTDCPSFC